MKLIDNHVEKFGNDLKKELSKIQKFKFIFSDPTFVEKIKNENQFNKKVELNKQLNKLLLEEKNV